MNQGLAKQLGLKRRSIEHHFRFARNIFSNTISHNHCISGSQSAMPQYARFAADTLQYNANVSPFERASRLTQD